MRLEDVGPGHFGEIRASRSSRPRTLPTVWSVREVGRFLDAMPDRTEAGIIARLLSRHGHASRHSFATHVMSRPAVAVIRPLDRLVATS